MSTQRISLRLGSPELASRMPDLAVEVHDSNLALAGRGTLAKGIELETDRDYFFSATLPNGSRVSTHAKVVPDMTELVLPEPMFSASAPADALDQSPRGDDPSGVRLESRSFREAAPIASRASRSAKVPAGPSSRTTKPSWRVAGFRANLLSGKPQYFELERIETSAPTASDFAPGAEILGAWSVPFDEQPTFIQLAQRGQPVWNYAVPIGTGETCVVGLVRPAAAGTVSEAGPEPLAVDIRLHNKNADLLLRYLGNNLVQEVTQSAESVGILAQDLLGAKFDSPIGAVVGAYALLRFGQLDRLHDWTQNLCHRFGWLPDGVVILAEHLARVGRHQEALETLIKLPDRGLPFFVAGLTYAVNRLRQYQGPVHNKKLSGDAGAVDRLCSALGRYSGLVDVTRPILTFVGRDPLNPSHRPGRLP